MKYRAISYSFSKTKKYAVLKQLSYLARQKQIQNSIVKLGKSYFFDGQ